MQMKKNDLVRKFKRSQSLPKMAQSLVELEQWLQSDAGKRLLNEQQILFDEALERLFGYRLLQMSISREAKLFQRSKISHCFSMGPLAGGNIAAISDENLPLENESLDVVLLHHVLEYSQQPHQLLREAARVTLPSGYMLIAGFNPISPIGAFSRFARMRRRGVWHNQLLSVNRVVDWLALMDFSVQSVQYGYYRLPLSGHLGKQLPKIERALNAWQLPFGGFYLVVAKKEVSRLTPLRLKARRVKSAIPVMGASFYTERPKRNANRINDQ